MPPVYETNSRSCMRGRGPVGAPTPGAGQMDIAGALAIVPRVLTPTRARRALPRMLLGCLLLAVVVGCSPLRRVSDCRRIVETVNPRLSEVEATLAAGAEETPERYEELAARYRELHAELGSLEVSDPRLKGAIDGYRALVEGSATQCQHMAEALRQTTESKKERNRQRRRIKQLRKQAERHVASQGPLVDTLNDLCRAT